MQQQPNQIAKKKIEFDSNNKEMNSNMWNKEQQIGSIGTITSALPLKVFGVYVCNREWMAEHLQSKMSTKTERLRFKQWAAFFLFGYTIFKSYWTKTVTKLTIKFQSMSHFTERISHAISAHMTSNKRQSSAMIVLIVILFYFSWLNQI